MAWLRHRCFSSCPFKCERMALICLDVMDIFYLLINLRATLRVNDDVVDHETDYFNILCADSRIDMFSTVPLSSEIDA